MNLLLDTHTFIWWDSEPSSLSTTVLSLCSDPANHLLLSVASIWEMQIKYQIGKLQLRLPLADIIAHQQVTNALTLLAITDQHVLALEGLPTPHKDPFDRMLVAQARTEHAILVSNDSIFRQYPVQVIW